MESHRTRESSKTVMRIKTNRKGIQNYYIDGGQIFETIGSLAPLLNMIPGVGQAAAPLVGLGASFLGSKYKQANQNNNGSNPTGYTNSNAFGYADGGPVDPKFKGVNMARENTAVRPIGNNSTEAKLRALVSYHNTNAPTNENAKLADYYQSQLNNLNQNRQAYQKGLVSPEKIGSVIGNTALDLIPGKLGKALNFAKAAQGGPNELIPFKDALQYIGELGVGGGNSSFKFAEGGSLQSLNSTSQVVTGAPNEIDGNQINYKGTSINLNHGETLDTNRDRVISDKYINPETGKRIIDEDKRLKSLRGKAEKIYQTTNDTAAKNTIKRTQEMEDNLYSIQENEAMKRGDRNSDGSTVQKGKRYKDGGSLQPKNTAEQELIAQLMHNKNVQFHQDRATLVDNAGLDPMSAQEMGIKNYSRRAPNIDIEDPRDSTIPTRNAELIAQMQQLIQQINRPQHLEQPNRMRKDDSMFGTDVTWSQGGPQSETATNYPAFTPSATPGISSSTATNNGKPTEYIPSNNKVSTMADKPATKGRAANLELQRKLVELGYSNIGKAGIKNDIDGIIGGRTNAAIRDAVASGKLDNSYLNYIGKPKAASSTKAAVRAGAKARAKARAEEADHTKTGTDGFPLDETNQWPSDFKIPERKEKGFTDWNNFQASNKSRFDNGSPNASAQEEESGLTMRYDPLTGAIVRSTYNNSGKESLGGMATDIGNSILGILVPGGGMATAARGAKVATTVNNTQKLLNAGQKALNAGKVVEKVGKVSEAAVKAKGDWQFLKNAMEAAKAAGNSEKAAKIAARMSEYSKIGREAFATGGSLKSYALGTGPNDLKGPLLSNQNPTYDQMGLNPLGQLNYGDTFTKTTDPLFLRPTSGLSVKSNMPQANPTDLIKQYDQVNGTKPIGQSSSNMWSDMTMGEKVGLGTSALSVALKATDSFGKIQKEPYRYNNAAISLNQLDPTAILNNNQQSYQSALNDLNNNSSTGSNRAAIAANLFNNKLRANNDVMTKYGEQNSNLATQYEQRLAQRNSENNNMAYQVDDLNSKNRGAAQQMRQGVYGDLATLGLNQANVLNNRLSQNATLEALKMMAPAVYENYMKNIKLK